MAQPAESISCPDRAGDSDGVQLSSWSLGRGKRALDLVCTVPLVFAVAPLMAVVAVLVRMTSRGPVLFRQSRCGKDGQIFQLLKFRSMRHLDGCAGPGLTAAGDNRVTPLGRLLRKWKLDELPQLLNVLRGDMTLVGPRPDLPEYLAGADHASRQVLRLRPGITGWATLQHRHEEALLAAVPPSEVEKFYIRVLLPKKARLDLEYGARATFWGDLRILALTCRAVVR